MLAELQRLEDLPGDLDLLLGVEGRERDADRVADAVGEERAEADRGLERARPLRARLGDAEVERIVDPLGEDPVGGDRVRHVRRLDRDLEVGEVERLHQLDELDGGLRERLDGVLALELVEVLGQRAGVDADPHRHARGGRLLRHLGDLVAPADVARVQADAVGAGVDRLEREGVVEVDVGDDRDRRLAHDRLERVGVLLARHGDAHEVGAGLGDLADLLHRGLEIGRFRLRHRLHGNGRAPTDEDPADVHLAL